MKTKPTFVLFIVFLLIGCAKNETDPIKQFTDGFCIKSNDQVVINRNDIDYYDYSTHLIYLKNQQSFTKDIKDIEEFTVYADGNKIYSGHTVPWYSNSMPSGSIIHTQPSFYGDYILSIEFINRLDSLGNLIPDPREDQRIIEALKHYNQFHSGLSCVINSVQYSPNHVVVELKLENPDSFNYYYLDPDKMGIKLYHFFTNGLYLRDLTYQNLFTHKMEVIQPETLKTWKKEWLSIIKSDETKLITLTYTNFEQVPPGNYKASFTFPGLSFQIDKNDLQQADGRIWLGELGMVKDVMIE